MADALKPWPSASRTFDRTHALPPPSGHARKIAVHETARGEDDKLAPVSGALRRKIKPSVPSDRRTVEPDMVLKLVSMLLSGTAGTAGIIEPVDWKLDVVILTMREAARITAGKHWPSSAAGRTISCRMYRILL